ARGAAAERRPARRAAPRRPARPASPAALPERPAAGAGPEMPAADDRLPVRAVSRRAPAGHPRRVPGPDAGVHWTSESRAARAPAHTATSSSSSWAATRPSVTGTRKGSTRSTVSGKASKAEVMKRVEAVFELRLGGAEYHDIVKYANAPERHWGVKETQLRQYIRRADALCKHRFDAQADHLLSRHLLQRRRLFAHAMDVEDYRTALAVLKDEAALEGLYERRDARTDLLEAFLASLPAELARATRA